MIPKFRAWDKENDKILRVSTIDWDAQEINQWTDKYGFMRNRDFGAIVLMQSTGLKDKNGVEVYEGDVVNITQYFGGHPYGETKHIIKRSKYNNNLVADSESGNSRMPEVSMSFRKSDDYEVIGNIYDNSELLEEEE